MIINREQMMAKRDKKVGDVFSELAPVWLINDEYRAREDSFVFNVVYNNPVDSWINQHLRYDLFNDVLYRLGEKYVSEESLLKIQEQEPYISGSGDASIPNHPEDRR
jgi:hypothetical protein